MMPSASAISAMIRAKKKRMEEEHSDAVKLSGIPEDATDILTVKQHEMTDAMNENHTPSRDEDPLLPAEREQEMEGDAHGGMILDPDQVNTPEDGGVQHILGHEETDQLAKRKSRLKAALFKMGK